jgi:tRNA-5-taurinomethyluridine 2-sulfurtransferase
VFFLFFCFINKMFFLVGAFLDAIGGMGFDYVASGHYAKVIHPFADEMDGPSALELSQDTVPI